MRGLGRVVVVFGWLTFIPASAYAQATIAGAVKDASGAVLPGVTVEAASPALIEKVRSVVTDGTGQYRIVDLRPGAYTLTFTLPGFATVKREGVELTGAFTATIDTEMRVGALEETITVTGETPTVDIQSATRQQVMDHSIIDSIPSGRSTFALGVLVPGIVARNTGGTLVQDVGGSRIDAALGLSIHGSRQLDQTILFNGISTSSQASTGYATRTTINPVAVQEVTFDYSAINAETGQGGVRINMIPKDGGNSFSGTFHADFANSSWQSDNFTQELKDKGLGSPDKLRTNWDINPGVGGPILRDRIWFYGSGRWQESSNYVAGIFANRNANNPATWTYEADPSEQGYNGFTGKSGDVRLTWQAAAKHKVGFGFTYQRNCGCPQIVSATVSPEADQRATFPRQSKLVFDWSSPLTTRLLLEAGFLQSYGASNRDPVEGLDPAMITVFEQSNGMKYRGPDPGTVTTPLRHQTNVSNHIRLATSYITGAHAMKVGLVHTSGYFSQATFDIQPVSYRFNNGVPNQIWMRAFPYDQRVNTDHDVGVFGQDTWTVRRLTLGLGVRYDHFGNSQPEQHLGPTFFTPTRDITFPATPNLSWNDITPKLSAAYDLFGTGKTAVKVSLNKYVESLAAGSGLPNMTNPLNALTTSTTRSWNDANRNFIPDCDLRNPVANGECSAMASSNLGQPLAGTPVDPDLMTGWNKRVFNWEFAASVQREIMPRVAVDIGYFRRWYGNFIVTDNRTVGASDYDTFSITAPVDARLPGGGGYVISGLYDLKPSRFGLAANNVITLARNYGTWIEHWNGFDFTLSARPRSGVLLQGGVSTGRTLTDNCEVVAQVPELMLTGTEGGINGNSAPNIPYCHQQTPFLTQVKALGSYTVPKAEVQISGTFQSFNSPQYGIAANYVATNAVVAPSLGRNLSGNAANITVNLIAPNSLYGDRVNQLDMRVGRLLRFHRTRTNVALDIYNVLNANPVMTENANYATFRRPTSIMGARFAKITMQFDF